MRNCVRVARQTLTLFVWVQILVPQPKPQGRQVLGAYFLPITSSLLPKLRKNRTKICYKIRLIQIMYVRV